jgi:ribosomal protein S18 acetylase RimI-like enzyme
MSFRHVAEPRDADRVRKLVAATGFFRPDEIDIAVELVTEALAKGRDSGYRFVFADAPEGSDLAGYACYGPVPATQSGFDLYWIAVSPAAQRQGLGQRLLAATEVEARAEGGQRLYADTSGRPDYAPTRAFYHRSGFVVAAVFPDFYADGDDKVVFSKPLA